MHNDTMEIAAFTKLFGQHKVPIHSVKGALGHTLGAAGALETVVGVESLKSQQIPPTIGLNEAEDEVSGLASSDIQNFSGNHLMLTNSGFGGVNAALILESS